MFLEPAYLKEDNSPLRKKKRRQQHDKDFSQIRRTKARLSEEQKQVLEAEYLKQSFWSTELIKKIAKRLDLEYRKVYKWNWERLKK